MVSFLKEYWSVCLGFVVAGAFFWFLVTSIPKDYPFMPEVEYVEPAPYVTLERFDAWAKTADARLDAAITACTPKEAAKPVKKAKK